MKSASPAFVYFLRPIGQCGPIKIGCSFWPEDRLKSYQSWSPIPLELVASLPGDRTIEARFHAAFAHLHSHHEWFRAEADLLRAIKAVRAGAFDLSSLPAPRALWAGRVVPREAVDSGRMTRRVYRLLKAGVPVPPEIIAATQTYRCTAAETCRRRAVVRAWVMAQAPDTPQATAA